MDDLTFNECLGYYRQEMNHKDTTWEKLAKQYNYQSGEALRSQFKRERKKRNIVKENKKVSSQRIICFDIERTPLIAYSWSLWENSIHPENVVQDSYILCWSAKELNSPNISSDRLTCSEATTGYDERIVRSLWNYLDGAKILIGHNIEDFDVKVMNTRFIIYGLPPISSFQTVDTLKVARRKFLFQSNKLSYINKFLDIKQKIENSGMALWTRCMNGDPDALSEMNEYCQRDVSAVEELYYRFRPYISGHPNLGLFNDDPNNLKCPNCGYTDLSNNGFYFTSVGKYNSMRCNSCGALSRTRYDTLDKELKKTLLRN